MAVTFNRYLILPEIEKSELKVSQENKRRYTDEKITRNSSNEQKTSVTPTTVPLCVLSDVQLRFLCPDDLEEVRALCQDWFPIDERILSKWRNIKDTYMRSVRKKFKSGQGADSGRQYIYARQLSFLTASRNTINTENSIRDENVECTVQTETTEQNSHNINTHHNMSNIPITHDRTNQAQPLTKRRRKEALEESLITFMNTPLPNPPTHNDLQTIDDDRSFFDSLLPMTRQLNLYQKLEFRSEVLQLLKNLIQNPHQPQYTQPVSTSSTHTSRTYFPPNHFTHNTFTPIIPTSSHTHTFTTQTSSQPQTYTQVPPVTVTHSSSNTESIDSNEDYLFDI